MNRMKRWIALLLAGALFAGVLTSCGGGGEGTSLSSEDTMPLPETTLSTTTVPEPPEGTFALTQDGRAMFQFVFCSNASAEVISEVEQMTARLNGLGAQTQAVADYRVNAMQPCEILVGADVRYRDEFSDVDVHTVGIRGYIIKAVGERVMIAGGSDDALLEGLHFFAEHYLGVTEDSESLPDVRLSASLFLESVTDDYAITSLTLAGEDIRSYQIAADHARKSAFAAAQNLQAGIYMYTGAWLEIVDPDEAGERQIRFSEVSDAGSDGFRIRVEGTGMHVESSYHNSFEVGARAFVDQVLVRGSGDLVWDETLAFSENISVLHYSQFGAVGDGVTDDFEAIYAAHACANLDGQTVYADPGATYYIGSHSKSVIIKTDTVWGDARFTIDDRQAANYKSMHIFQIASDYASTGLTGISSLRKGQENIGIAPGYPCLLVIMDASTMQYIRYGSNQNSGTAQQEVILVDADGNVDPDTPILWDYDQVSSVTAYRVDDRPVTVSGGIFTTIANQEPSEYTYFNRGISITRSNTILRGVTHRITGEGSTGAPYNGFYAVSCANNVLIDKCVLTGHKTYSTIGSAGSKVSMGTYDTTANRANAVTWRGCTQTNSITNGSYWGVMASNFCKNLTYDGCNLSRFDAHMGMYNATVINTTLGHSFNAIGSGTLLVENTTKATGGSFLALRGDYGSTWEGDVIFRDCTFNASSNTPSLISASWVRHDFGYVCFLPQNVVIENLKVADRVTAVYLFSKFTSNANVATDATNPYQITKTVTVIGGIRKGETTVSFALFPDANLRKSIFKDTELIEN